MTLGCVSMIRKYICSLCWLLSICKSYHLCPVFQRLHFRPKKRGCFSLLLAVGPTVLAFRFEWWSNVYNTHCCLQYYLRDRPISIDWFSTANLSLSLSFSLSLFSTLLSCHFACRINNYGNMPVSRQRNTQYICITC